MTIHYAVAAVYPAATFLAVALGCGALLWPDQGAAEGAVAIGTTGNVVRSGWAFAISVNSKTPEEASADAVEQCKKQPADKPALERCKVERGFRDACAAGAMDPRAGTPGVGWGIAATRRDAEVLALADCEKTAGPGRRDACKVHLTLCDGAGK